jgi:hypothetical protein
MLLEGLGHWNCYINEYINNINVNKRSSPNQPWWVWYLSIR